MMLRSLKILRRERIVFTLTVAAFLIYAALFIYKTSFVIGGQRYFSLFDDAMISMRYAKNLAHGYGLVWNPGGERVEGYTDPLWVMYMALIHLFPIAQSKISLLVQISSAIFLAVNLYFVRRIALFVSDGSEAIALGAAILTALYLPINFWSLQGMEVSVSVLLVSVCLWQALTYMRDKTFSIWLYILLGVGTWVRPDMVVPFAALMLFLAAVDPIHRRRHVVWGSVILLAFCATQTAFRLWYFGDVFPNTYYLKLTGYPFILRVSRGLYVLAKFMWGANLLLFAIPFMLAAVRRDRRTTLLLWVFVVQMMYSVYVGGDAWEYWGGSNRYISIAMPGFFILLSYGLLRISQMIIDIVQPESRPAGGTTAFWKMSVFPLLIVFSLVSVNNIHDDALAEVLLLKAPLHTGSDEENQADVEEALRLREITTPEAKILVGRAGTIPYFSDRYSIDSMGKADRYIAHEPMRTDAYGLTRLIEFRPGHMKYDYGYSIGQLEPDMIAFELFLHTERARPYLQGRYTKVRLQGKCLYFRKKSSNVLWERLLTHDGSKGCATE